MSIMMTMSLTVRFTAEQFARIVRFVKSVWTGTELSEKNGSAFDKGSGTISRLADCVILG